MKNETKFRVRKVLPFLKTLQNTFYEPIQQLAIRGSPDYILCVNGRFIALELKKDAKEKPRKLQEHKLQKIQKSGGISLVASPDNWDEVSKFLKHLADAKENSWKLQLRSSTKI